MPTYNKYKHGLILFLPMILFMLGAMALILTFTTSAVGNRHTDFSNVCSAEYHGSTVTYKDKRACVAYRSGSFVIISEK